MDGTRGRFLTLLARLMHVILGESSVKEWHSKNARASELLDFFFAGAVARDHCYRR